MSSLVPFIYQKCGSGLLGILLLSISAFFGQAGYARADLPEFEAPATFSEIEELVAQVIAIQTKGKVGVIKTKADVNRLALLVAQRVYVLDIFEYNVIVTKLFYDYRSDPRLRDAIELILTKLAEVRGTAGWREEQMERVLETEEERAESRSAFRSFVSGALDAWFIVMVVDAASSTTLHMIGNRLYRTELGWIRSSLNAAKLGLADSFRFSPFNLKNFRKMPRSFAAAVAATTAFGGIKAAEAAFREKRLDPLDTLRKAKTDLIHDLAAGAWEMRVTIENRADQEEDPDRAIGIKITEQETYDRAIAWLTHYANGIRWYEEQLLSLKKQLPDFRGEIALMERDIGTAYVKLVTTCQQLEILGKPGLCDATRDPKTAPEADWQNTQAPLYPDEDEGIKPQSPPPAERPEPPANYYDIEIIP